MCDHHYDDVLLPQPTGVVTLIACATTIFVITAVIIGLDSLCLHVVQHLCVPKYADIMLA